MTRIKAAGFQLILVGSGARSSINRFALRLNATDALIRKSWNRFFLATNANAFVRRSCSNNELKRDGIRLEIVAP